MIPPTQPAAPAPTPRTDAVIDAYGEYNELTASDDMPFPTELLDLARDLERELNAAKQPVPDAGVREALQVKVSLILSDYFNNPTIDNPTATNAILALFPAPTPATSEDTLMLDWLESQKAIPLFVDGEYLVEWDFDENGNESAYGVTLRQALRAAMAHAGAQKT